ncbi:M20/M25/M40 family metallo-hydrolase [Streptomyces sp. NBC_00083]|uniref:M20/M25/M40 family metallo-hydrolase n=1 Tax=Streptomyces sp. NBC_00083 TaxID=2975647 RepID=UPI0022583F7D|nr:M20/M25/M40 family metallo-hydrolase [Streptomyces sp. NBC_00083]MCX5382367.1 M20/M25/M40 family metallo-hydrolase [Streptomyces sp. NBC_00083]
MTDPTGGPFGPSETEWLLDLMAVPSVSPFEGGKAELTRDAQRVFLDGALARGFTEVLHAGPPAAFLTGADVPAPVRAAVLADPEGFLAAQPSAVVRMGRPAAPEHRLIVNFHVDTVGPHIDPRIADGVLYGRGAVDDKGPGIAAAAGIAAAFAAEPWLAGTIEAQLASVPGEEGGAMGTYGTRWLVDSGLTGRLMLFAEPTGGRVMDACTAAMTPRIRVAGSDSTDDHPAGGHNATVALGFLADFLVRRLGPRAQELGAKLCVAGLRTGDAHNRVYGTGELLMNIAYQDRRQAVLLERELEDLLRQARAEFAAAHAGSALTERLVADWDEVIRFDWLKRGLPVLDNRDQKMEALLGAAGFPRHDGLADGSAFTCDAIWAGGPGRYVAVCGPGGLDTHGAHTPGEFLELAELARYARQIKDLVVRFGTHIATQEAER